MPLIESGIKGLYTMSKRHYHTYVCFWNPTSMIQHSASMLARKAQTGNQFLQASLKGQCWDQPCLSCTRLTFQLARTPWLFSTLMNTAAVAHCNNYEAAVISLQSTVHRMSSWAEDRKISLNESKSIRVDFSLRPHPYVSICLDGKVIPPANHARYLGLNSDCKLNWQEHVRRKWDLLNRQLKKYYWLIGPYSELSLVNKRLIYSSIFKPAWAYGCKLWGATAISNHLIIERFQNKYTKAILSYECSTSDWSWYHPCRRGHLAKGGRYSQRLNCHSNVEAIALLDSSNDIRRLRRSYNWDCIS